MSWPGGPGGGHVRIIPNGDGAIDPDGLLLSIRSMIRAVKTADAEGAPHEERAALGLQVALLADQLDHFLTSGGVPPQEWQPVRSWQMGNRRAQLPAPARSRRRPW